MHSKYLLKSISLVAITAFFLLYVQKILFLLANKASLLERNFIICFNYTIDLPNPGFHFKTRRSSTHVDSPVTSETGSTSGISGSGSSNGSDATLVNAEETYTSSLFQTEPLYQFYDVSGGSHTIKVRYLSDYFAH